MRSSGAMYESPGVTPLRTPATVAQALLAPLNEHQQRLVDLAAVGLAGGTWPIFDFIDREFERDGIDAWAVLESLPRLRGIGEYQVAWCPRPPGGRPASTEPVRLTILGMHHAAESSPAAGAIVSAFLALLPKLAVLRLAKPGGPQQPRVLQLSSGSSLITGIADGIGGFPTLPTEFLFNVLAREPPTWAGQAQLAGPSWHCDIPREVIRFGAVTGIDDYVALMVEQVCRESRPRRLQRRRPSVSSPHSITSIRSGASRAAQAGDTSSSCIALSGWRS